jgi:glyoxylase-like metal-dependent hydrolase (beta-lactamase superfamily II)
MWRRALAGAVMVPMILSWTLNAQDATAVLERAGSAMGGIPKSIQYSGTGANYQFGQSVRPGGPWPRYTVRSYTAAIDYGTPSMRVELVRIQDHPEAVEQRQVQVVSGTHAWNVAGENTVATPAAVSERLAQVWSTPHGFLKGAAANASSATVTTEAANGRKLTRVTFIAHGKHKVSGLIGDQGLVEKVETWVDSPVTGDTPVVTTFAEYKEFGGVKFPGRLVQHQGGFPTLELTISSVQPNAAVDLPVPSAVQSATMPSAKAEAQKIGEGVWYVAGGSHHSVAVEFPDHVAVIEGPQSEARSIVVIDEVKRVVPNKPIRYVINTHHHFDHSGGLRAFAAEGATIVTQAMNRPFYEKAFAAPRTLNPDKLSQSKKTAKFDTFTDKKVLSSGGRTLELHHVRANPHNDAILMAYLPKERILIEVDLYAPPTGSAPLPAIARSFATNLYDNVQRLKLDVDKVVPLHGRIATWTEFLTAIGKSST